jgi:hypothetical protein
MILVVFLSIDSNFERKMIVWDERNGKGRAQGVLNDAEVML